MASVYWTRWSLLSTRTLLKTEGGRIAVVTEVYIVMQSIVPVVNSLTRSHGPLSRRQNHEFWRTQSFDRPWYSDIIKVDTNK